jgi:hypothetical protein
VLTFRGAEGSESTCEVLIPDQLPVPASFTARMRDCKQGKTQSGMHEWPRRIGTSMESASVFGNSQLAANRQATVDSKQAEREAI